MVSALLRLAGASQIALGFAHVLIWRLFGWTEELRTLTPLTARVFAVHTFFVAFVLVAFGALQLAQPASLVTTPLGHVVLAGAALFWSLRLFAQPIVFDPVLLRGSRWRAPVRLCATTLFASYAGLYLWALYYR